jgi:hypothetical protein
MKFLALGTTVEIVIYSPYYVLKSAGLFLVLFIKGKLLMKRGSHWPRLVPILCYMC